MFNGSVFFRFSPTSGWRVSYVRPCVVNSINRGLAHRALFDRDEIAVTGTFKKLPRVGQFCKRPDQLVKIKEFRA